MIAIVTKYLGATETKGSRIKATANGNSITIGYPHELSGAAIFAKAAIALCEKMGWTGNLVSGGTNDGYVFCFDTAESFDNPTKS